MLDKFSPMHASIGYLLSRDQENKPSLVTNLARETINVSKNRGYSLFFVTDILLKHLQTSSCRFNPSMDLRNLILLAPTPQNGQIRSNNSSAFADELFECLTILWG